MRNHSALLAQCVVGFKDVVGRERQSVFFPEKKEREGGTSHLREERRLSFSGRLMTVRQFSSTADVTQTYAPLSLLSTVSSSSSALFSFPLYFPSLHLLIPFPPSCLLSPLTALSVGIFLSLSPLSPSFFSFFYIALSTSLFSPSFFFSQSSQRR